VLASSGVACRILISHPQQTARQETWLGDSAVHGATLPPSYLLAIASQSYTQSTRGAAQADSGRVSALVVNAGCSWSRSLALSLSDSVRGHA
jgi:hypothetical protein